MAVFSITDYWHNTKPRCVLGVIHAPTYRQLPPERMLDAAEQSLRQWDDSPANMPPALLPDFGTVTMAKPWGGRVFVQDNGEVFIEPAARSVDEALDIEPGSNPDIDLAVDMYRQLCNRLHLSDILFKTPDYQGVLNTAALVVQQDELMVSMYTEPEKVHRLLDIICRRNIEHIHRLRDAVGRTDGNIWPFVWVPQSAGVGITEDMMPLLSPELYRDFGLPYLKRIADEFGGVFIHCCGEWGRHAENLSRSLVNIIGMEYHHPFTRIDEIRPHLRDVVLTPYLAGFKNTEFAGLAEYVDYMLGRDDAGPLWLALDDANPQLQAIRRVLAAHDIAEVTFGE